MLAGGAVASAVGAGAARLPGCSTHARAAKPTCLHGQPVRTLSLHHTVRWCVHTGNSPASLGLRKLVQEIPCERLDVVVMSIGANDATTLHTPGRWTKLQGTCVTPASDGATHLESASRTDDHHGRGRQPDPPERGGLCSLGPRVGATHPGVLEFRRTGRWFDLKPETRNLGSALGLGDDPSRGH